MAGLAAVTSRIRLYATVPTLAVPPAIAARMCSTIDSISNGRFGLNVITGWQRPEYSQMGLWPGDAYFGHRYRYATEYVHVLRDLWETGVSDLKGEFFTMNDCRLSPRPKADMKIICAGQQRRRPGIHRQARRLQFLLRQGHQHADGLRRHGGAHAGLRRRRPAARSPPTRSPW